MLKMRLNLAQGSLDFNNINFTKPKIVLYNFSSFGIGVTGRKLVLEIGK